MPGTPKPEASQGVTPQGQVVYQTRYSVDVDNGAGTYLVGRMDYPNTTTLDPGATLDGVAGGSGGKLSSRRILTVHGLQAVEGLITGVPGGGAIWMRVAVKGSTAFLLEYFVTSAPTLSTPASTPPAGYTKFVDSFGPV